MRTVNLGQKIKDLRTSMHLTQEEFALAIQVGKSTISAYESGKRIPSYENLLKIASYFNVLVDNLLNSDDSYKINLEGLTLDQKAKVQNMVSTYQQLNNLYKELSKHDAASANQLAPSLKINEEENTI